MTLNQARTLANINTRAQRITQDYHCTILPDSILVIRRDDPKRRYEVKDGTCSCPSFAEHDTCKHLLGTPDLIDAEITRLTHLLTVQDSENTRQAIQNGREILDAHLCEMDVNSYRNAIAD